MAEGPVDVGLRARLAWVTGARLFVLTLLLGATAFFYLRGSLDRYPESMRIVFSTIALAYAISAVEAAMLRRVRRLRALAVIHLVIDQCLWTAIVYVSGGPASGATSFYGLTVLVGAVLIGVRGAAVAGAVGFALYGALGSAIVTHLVVPPPDQPLGSYATTWRELLYPLLLNALGIGVVGMLAGYLAERLRTTGGALEVARRRYTEAERLAELGRIAAWLAHEIRNPLGSISGSIEMLREAPALSPEDRELCDIVSREVTRLNDLVGDMLDLSKTRRPSAEAVDVAELARDVVSLANRSAAPKAVTVAYEGPAGEVATRCDGAQMRQVLWNLVRNAVQVSPSGSTVTVRVDPEGDRVALTVDDRGPGITPETRARIFDAFYTTHTHGVGIGLAVVKRIVDDHASMGATIEVQSLDAGGTRFRVTLRRPSPSLRRSLSPRALAK